MQSRITGPAPAEERMDHTLDQANLTLFAYKKCTTCQKAVKWLKEQGIAYEERDMYEHPPETKYFYHWIEEEQVPLKKFLNTSGQKYRELNMKERLPKMTVEEVVAMLSSHGKLVKRPILTDGEHVLVGFQEVMWKDALIGK